VFLFWFNFAEVQNYYLVDFAGHQHMALAIVILIVKQVAVQVKYAIVDLKKIGSPLASNQEVVTPMKKNII